MQAVEPTHESVSWCVVLAAHALSPHVRIQHAHTRAHTQHKQTEERAHASIQYLMQARHTLSYPLRVLMIPCALSSMLGIGGEYLKQRRVREGRGERGSSDSCTHPVCRLFTPLLFHCLNTLRRSSHFNPPATASQCNPTEQATTPIIHSARRSW